MNDETSKFESEMNRGFLQVLVLVLLEKSMYGYMMLKHFDRMGYAVEENTESYLLNFRWSNRFHFVTMSCNNSIVSNSKESG